MAKDKRERRVPHAEKMREETSEQKRMFETYFLMGDDRSYRKLAKQLGKGSTTISNWFRQFNRQERIEQRDELVNRGKKVNRKKVQRIMKELGLKFLVRMKKYKSYKGT